MSSPCPFCTLSPINIIYQNEHSILIRDTFPISPGHSLIIPKRHISSFFEIKKKEQKSILKALIKAREIMINDLQPAGFNIGVNDGVVAGQTIPHLHIHLIPRFQGDVEDPKGGIRWILPEKANYWDRKKD
jgi:diadenosine tetraphosphate (Ap4A) HIT family hydrolase